MSLLRKKYNSIPPPSLTLASMLYMNFSFKQIRNQDGCFTFGLPPIQKLWKIYASFVKCPQGLCKFYMSKCKRKFAIFMPPPLQRSGGILLCSCRSVGPSIHLSVGRPFLVWMITSHRIDLGLSNLAQTCVSRYR